MTATLRVLALLEAIGLAGLPLAARALGRLPGGGLAFAKPLGLLLLAWLTWFAGSLGIPNGAGLPIAAALVLALWAAAAHALRRREVAPDPLRRRLWIASEAVFLAVFAVATLLMSFAADVWGTEKPMDMALTNATIVSPSYPPNDPWMSGEQLNYYYLGQLAAGLLIRLTGVEPSAGYNLAVAAIIALAATGAFALGATLARRRPLSGGFATLVLLLVIGNLHGGWAALHASSWTGFDWFAQSRVIPYTINEFPLFSLLVADLHAHVIALPLTLLALAFVAQAWLGGPPRARRLLETFCAALAIGFLYGVNSWSWPVLAGLAVLAGAAHGRRGIGWALATLALGIVLVLPFIIDFDPNAGGVAIVDEREPLGRFLSHNVGIYGALAWVLAALYAGRLLRARHPVRVLVWGAAGAIVVLPLASGAHLAGAAAVAALAIVALHAAFSSSLSREERFVWLLASGGFALIAIPELVYVRDEFEGSQFVRMNTVFKFGYQAWILLAVAGGVTLGTAATWLPRRALRLAWGAGAAAAIAVSLAFTLAGPVARTHGFADGPRLEGRAWLARTSPGDIAAIDWIRANLPGDAVILEAVGDDYSPFGNARISVYTGRPTVLGWQGHELQWSHDVGTRRADVEAIYSTADPGTVRKLLSRYRVAYAVVGPLERTTYGAPGALASLGRKVFDRRGTAIYAFPVSRPAPEPATAPVLGG